MTAHAAPRCMITPTVPAVARYAHSRGTPGGTPSCGALATNQPTLVHGSGAIRAASQRVASIAATSATVSTNQSHSDRVATSAISRSLLANSIEPGYVHSVI